jgi:hypothetical protein
LLLFFSKACTNKLSKCTDRLIASNQTALRRDHYS